MRCIVVLLVIALSGCVSTEPAVAPGPPPQPDEETHPASPPEPRPVETSDNGTDGGFAKTTGTAPTNVTAPANDTDPQQPAPYVVVATFDTGVNPFHPTWRVDNGSDPTAFLPGFPEAAVRVALSLSDNAAADREASAGAWQAALDHDGRPVVFEGTRIVAAKAALSDPRPFFDAAEQDHYHGARASSQIAGTGFAIGDHAYVVPMDQTGGASGDTYESFIAAQTEWILEQPWIDIVHVNMAFFAPYPFDTGPITAFEHLVESGRLVVLAGGNGAGNGGPPYPMELQHTSGAPGTLVAGANDQCAAGAYWSNLNPHVVMDGLATVAAHEVEYGEAAFSGTSSASPRIAGYAAELLYQVRAHYGLTYGLDQGALVVVDPSQAPETGPLADGWLTNVELHEIIRKTAAPPHDSAFDGDPFLSGCPGLPPGVPDYAKHGYGEVSEHTLDEALDVALGRAPMPERAEEDAFFGLSEGVREALHG